MITSALRTLFYAAAAILLAALLFRYCQKPPEKAVAHKENLKNIRSTQAVADSVALFWRFRYDSLITAYANRVNKVEVVIKEAKAQDLKAEAVYRAAPTLPKCDSALAAKSRRIGSLEGLDSLRVRQLQLERLRVQNADTLTAKQKRTILALEKGYEGAIRDLTKASRKRHFVLSAGVTTGINKELQPQNVVGLHLGYKLIQF